MRDRRRGPAGRWSVSRPVSDPRRPCLIVSPSAFTLVGSPTMQWSKVSPFARAQSSSFAVPLIDGPSSSPVTRKLIEPLKRALATKPSAAATAAATPALHVAGPAAPEAAVGDFGRERGKAPARRVSRRHDVGMAGEGEVRRFRSEAGVEVEDVRRPGRGEGHELGRESCFRRAGREDRAAPRRRPASPRERRSKRARWRERWGAWRVRVGTSMCSLIGSTAWRAPTTMLRMVPSPTYGVGG